MADFLYEDLLPIGDDTTEYRLLTTEGVSTVEGPDGRTFLQVEPEAMRLLTETALHDISHYLRTDHLTQLASILDDPEASNNDKFVALDLLKNAISPLPAFCRCARTPEPPSSWASVDSTYSRPATTRSPLPAVSTTHTRV